MEQYPTIRFIVERGGLLAIVIGLLPLLGGIAALAAGVHWLVVVAGLVGSAVLYFLMRSYVELVRVIADMLLPK